MLTNRQIFDKVKAHLLTQGERASNEDSCAYRDERGLKCAIGCLFADEDYSPEFEGLSILNALYPESIEDDPLPRLLLFKALRNAKIDYKASFQLLVELQKIHDRIPPSEWRAALDSLEGSIDL